MTQPSEKPSDNHGSFTSDDSPLVIIDGPLDTTRRPRRPSLPYVAPDAPLTNPPRKPQSSPPAEATDEPSPPPNRNNEPENGAPAA
jgi:hypothetical protein